jgi:predicted enzyme related to lactoylglutathione lyase
MSERGDGATGRIVWHDLTVSEASGARDFYCEVIGWNFAELQMEGYADYCMKLPDDDETVAGICHARGVNADLPPQWLIYFNVADLDRSMARCIALGGHIVAGPRHLNDGRFCVVRDPAGAAVALFEPPR